MPFQFDHVYDGLSSAAKTILDKLPVAEVVDLLNKGLLAYNSSTNAVTNRMIREEAMELALEMLEEERAESVKKAKLPVLVVQPVAEVKSSAIIGQIGEDHIRQLLAGKYNTITTAKSGKVGDLVIIINSIRILIEIKKYKTTIPRAEVDKFYRDIDNNANIDAGIFISLSSRITGIHKVIEYDHYITEAGTRTPVMFMAPGCDVATILYAATDILVAEVTSARRHVDVSGAIVNILDNINTSSVGLSQCRTIINETQAIINTQLNKITHRIMSTEIIIKHSIDHIYGMIESHAISEQKEIAPMLVGVAPTVLPLVVECIDLLGPGTAASADTIYSGNRAVAIKIMKTKVMVELTGRTLTDTVCILSGEWSYSAKKLKIRISPGSIDIIKGFIPVYLAA